MGDESEWLKLPAEEKCQHKSWKARLAGYEEVSKQIKLETDPKSALFNRYAGLMKKFVTDNNAFAQDKALDSVLAFVENAAVAARVCADVINGIINKCLGAPKQTTKDKGIEIILMYIEIEKGDVVQECLLQGTENKNPKIVVGSICALRTSLHEFGYKVMPIKPVMKILPKLLEDRDKNIREETKQMVIEMYRWIGNAIKPQMNHFKPVQVTELEGEFEKLGNEKAQQQRFMRSQQDLKAKMEEAAASGGGDEADGDGAEEEQIDAYELLPAVDILKQLPADFYDKIEAKKWQERKEALEALLKLLENPKLESGEYGALVKSVSKVVAKDTNVILVGIAGKCLTGLAIGLRKKFSPYALNCIQMILDKFKEKKINVVTALRDASDAIYPATTLDAIAEDCVAALDNKNPNIKAETALFLSRCFSKSSTATLPKKLLKLFCTALVKTINDTAPDVREASFTALGMAMRVVTEKNIMPFLPDIDSIKMQKIKECCEKAVLLNAKGEPRSGGGAAKAAPAKGSEPKPVERPKTAKPASKSAGDKKPKSATASKASAPKKDAKGKGGKKGAAAAGEVPTESVLSDDAVEDKVGALFPGDTLTQLVNANWKERLAAMETMTKTIKGLSKDDIPCQAVVRTIAKKPGLKDNNFQVLKLRIELVAHLAQNAKFTKISAESVLSDLVEKIGDVKNGKAVQECLSCIAEALTLEFVCREVIPMGFENKNPKNTAETLVWLAQAVKDFGMKLSVKPLITYIKKAFSATHPAVRTSAITVLTVIYMYMGQPLRTFFEDEKPALLQAIDAEFEKVKGEKPPTPCRGLVAATDGDDDEEEDEAPQEEVNVADLIPRNDIGEKFTPELMEELADKNWKIRKEALEKIAAILNEAKFINGNLGSLPEGLKVRLGDNNKVLVGLTLGICVTLATNMGTHCKAHIRGIAPALLGCFGDSKPHLRQQAVNALNLWTEQTTLAPLVEIEAFADALKIENPNLRQELLGWLSEKLPNHKKLAVEFKICIPHLLSCLEDRNGDVRKKAQDALVPFMIHTGYDSFVKATSKIKPASKDNIMAILEKARGNLPAKPVKTQKAASAPVVSKSVKEDYNDYEPEPAKSRPVSGAGSDSGDSKPASKTVKKAVGKGKAAPAASSKKKQEEDTGPVMTVTVPKEQRFKEEKQLKVLKWNFIELRGEFIEQLRTQMEKNFNKSIMDQLFHNDFKFHIKAIEALMKCMAPLHDETLGNLDLILKWMTIRFFDTNPSMLNKALEYLRNLFNMLSEDDYHLHELEASSFIPYLVIKVGENKDNVRKDVRTLFKMICNVYPASKMFTHLIDGLKSKNSKQRMECLEELGNLIESHGINICQPTPAQAMKTIAGNIGDKDNGVRNAALNTTVVAYMILQDKLFKFVHLKEKDQSMLDERIKRAMKNKPAQPVEERPTTAPAQPQRPAKQANTNRPSTAMPKSASSNSVKKEFALEVDDDQMSQPEIPNLYQYDLDELFQPVSMPSAVRARPPSPMRSMNSHDASAAVAMVISQITTADITMCIQALTQIDEVLKDEDKAEVLSNHVDQLLLSMSMQMKMVYSTHMSSEFTSKDDVTRLYRCLLGTLLAIFQNSSLAKKASKDVLKDLVNSLITILLDNRLTALDEGPQIIRTVNVMVVKIIEHGDKTSVLSALIRLLQDCVASETCTVKFSDLIMKCLWKITHMLPDIINDLNLDRILLDTHHFLKEFPSASWKTKPSDLPLRTVKTVLHSLVKLKGAKIIQHLNSIDSAENSEVKAYIQKILQNDPNAKNEWNEEQQKTPRSAQKPKKLNKNTHDVLAEIFKKIGSKENTREGLNDLYDFKKKYPDADLDPFLKKSSNFFQNYIERGLKNIEQEREGKVSSSDFGVSVRSDNLQQSSHDTSIGHQHIQQVDYYRERLKLLRSRCGLDNSQMKIQTEETPVIAEPPSPEPEILIDASPIEEPQPSISKSTSSTDVSELKQRLERIKKLAKS